MISKYLFEYNFKELPIVSTASGYKTISECKFPDFSKFEEKHFQFYDICSKIISQIVPIPECYLDWHKIIKGDASTWGTGLIFSLDDLVTLIESRMTLTQFVEFKRH